MRKSVAFVITTTVLLFVLVPTSWGAAGKPAKPPVPAVSATAGFESSGAVYQAFPVGFERTALKKASGSYESIAVAEVSTELGQDYVCFKDCAVCDNLESSSVDISAGRFHFRWDGVCEDGIPGSCEAAVRWAYEDVLGNTVRFYCAPDVDFTPGDVVEGDPFQGIETEAISCMSVTARVFDGKKLLGSCMWLGGSLFEITAP